MRGDHPGTGEVDKEASPERALYQRPLYLKFSITRPGTAGRSPFESRSVLGARKFLYSGFFYTGNICIPKFLYNHPK